MTGKIGAEQYNSLITTIVQNYTNQIGGWADGWMDRQIDR